MKNIDLTLLALNSLEVNDQNVVIWCFLSFLRIFQYFVVCVILLYKCKSEIKPAKSIQHFVDLQMKS